MLHLLLNFLFVFLFFPLDFTQEKDIASADSSKVHLLILLGKSSSLILTGFLWQLLTQCFCFYLDMPNKLRMLTYHFSKKHPRLLFFIRSFKYYLGTNEGYLLLQEVWYCTGITKPHKIILIAFFCVCFFLYVSMQ
jgi:hypothetical protein